MTDFTYMNDARKWAKRWREADKALRALERKDWVADKDVAAWRGESESTFRRKLPELEADGLPPKKGGKRYMPAIKAWAMEEKDEESTDEEQALAAIERHRLTLVR